MLPPLAAQTEGNGAELWLAGPFTARRQIILDGLWLQAAVGRAFQSLSFRRNQGVADHHVGGHLFVEIALAHAAVAPDQATSDFAANRREAPLVVFAGPIAFPPAPPAPITPAPWQAPYAIALPFTVPFQYRGGPLVVETTTRPMGGRLFSNPWWPVDAVIGTATGDARNVGRGCITGTTSPQAGADRGSFMVGASGALWLRGLSWPAPAVCLIGGDDRSYLGLPLPLDLTPAGLPTCHLYNDILGTLFTVSTPWQGGQGGLATVGVRIPPEPALTGAVLFAQWVVAMSSVPPRLATSNGVRVVIGSVPSEPGAAWVESTGVVPGPARVLHDRCPVIRLGFAP